MSIIPETNVSMRAVRTVLFEGTRSLWELCHSPKINKWSKFKPVDQDPINPPSDMCFGFKMPYAFTGLEQNVSFEKLTKKWNYVSPSIARLGDFRGYAHNSVKPFNADIQCSSELTLADYISSTVSYQTDLDSPQMNMLDIVKRIFNDDSVRYLYHALLVRVKNNPSKWIVNGAAFDDTLTIRLSDNPIFKENDEIECIPFITSRQIPQTISSESSGASINYKALGVCEFDKEFYRTAKIVPPTFTRIGMITVNGLPQGSAIVSDGDPNSNMGVFSPGSYSISFSVDTTGSTYTGGTVELGVFFGAVGSSTLISVKKTFTIPNNTITNFNIGLEGLVNLGSVYQGDEYELYIAKTSSAPVMVDYTEKYYTVSGGQQYGSLVEIT